MLRVQIEKGIERRFREMAMRKFGFGKGSLSKAAQEAFLRWISSVEDELLKFEGDPVEEIDGLLAGIPIDSVELQHMVKKLWLKRG